MDPNCFGLLLQHYLVCKWRDVFAPVIVDAEAEMNFTEWGHPTNFRQVHRKQREKRTHCNRMCLIEEEI